MTIYTYFMKLGLLLISLLLSVFSYANNKSLSVAIPKEGYAPYIIIENGQVFGILIEPLQLAAKNLGIELTYAYYPEKRSQAMLERGLVDARMESKLWVDNPQDYLWSEPITSLEDVFVFNKDSKSSFETDQDLVGAEIVTHLGYTYPTLQPLFEQGVIHRMDASSERDMLNHLFKPIPGVNRASVINKYVATWIIQSTPMLHNRLLLSKRRVDIAPLQFQFIKNNRLEEIVKQLNTELRKLKDDRTIEKITNRIINKHL